MLCCTEAALSYARRRLRPRPASSSLTSFTKFCARSSTSSLPESMSTLNVRCRAWYSKTMPPCQLRLRSNLEHTCTSLPTPTFPRLSRASLSSSICMGSVGSSSSSGSAGARSSPSPFSERVASRRLLALLARPRLRLSPLGPSAPWALLFAAPAAERMDSGDFRLRCGVPFLRRPLLPTWLLATANFGGASRCNRGEACGISSSEGAARCGADGIPSVAGGGDCSSSCRCGSGGSDGGGPSSSSSCCCCWCSASTSSAAMGAPCVMPGMPGSVPAAKRVSPVSTLETAASGTGSLAEAGGSSPWASSACASRACSGFCTASSPFCCSPATA
mmetsp:Transcript_9932/g.36326  ORF Transcript_9932/g.36326 Transcript_9932/m.36326 type:complete len:332 (-) Transcript_9932:6064-7059(-)